MCLLTKAGTASLCAPTETFNTPTETWTRSITLKARRRKTRTQEYCIETCAEQVDRLTQKRAAIKIQMICLTSFFSSCEYTSDIFPRLFRPPPGCVPKRGDGGGKQNIEEVHLKR